MEHTPEKPTLTTPAPISTPAAHPVIAPVALLESKAETKTKNLHRATELDIPSESNLPPARKTPQTDRSDLPFTRQDLEHPETTPLEDPKEQALWRRLETALGQPDPDMAAIELAFTEWWDWFCEGTLSQPALYRFANACYAYWERELPDCAAYRAAWREAKQCEKTLKTHAQGRELFREIKSSETPPCRYYWGSRHHSTLPRRTGAFYLCHP